MALYDGRLLTKLSFQPFFFLFLFLFYSYPSLHMILPHEIEFSFME